MPSRPEMRNPVTRARFNRRKPFRTAVVCAVFASAAWIMRSSGISDAYSRGFRPQIRHSAGRGGASRALFGSSYPSA